MSNANNEENRYFQEEFAEQRRQMRAEFERAAREARASHEIEERLNLDDPRLAERIRALGFDGDTARVFDLLPLIHVAWADGRIQPAERARIMEILRTRKIGPGTQASLFVEALLETRPTQEFMDESLAVLRDVLRGREGAISSVIDMSVAIADAAGGFLGFGQTISAEEREAIEQVARELGSEGMQTVRLLLG